MIRFLSAIVSLCFASAAMAQGPEIDLKGYKAPIGVVVSLSDEKKYLHLMWSISKGDTGHFVLNLEPGQPLIRLINVLESVGAIHAVADYIQPAFFLTVGSRDLKEGWNVFFDNPPKRAHETFAATIKPKKVRLENVGNRVTVILDGLTAGPFSGDLRFTIYPGCRLIRMEAVVSTEKEAVAFLYDAGLTAEKPFTKNIGWLDAEDKPHVEKTNADAKAEPLAVKQRCLVAESNGGSLAIFPPPHQYLYPLDFANNFKFVWHGRGYRGGDHWGMGIRQPPEGDGRFVPWMNAPPKSVQKLGMFMLIGSGDAANALAEVGKFTRDDKFAPLEGYRTFTSHYHIEHTLDFIAAQRKQNTEGIPKGLEEPPFVKAFKALGVDIVHLAEFHVKHTPELNAQRLELLKTLHGECKRLSNEKFLLLPGEEPNVQLGGHWISMFPKPVYWELHPKAEAPFQREIAGLGTVYAVKSPEDVLKLMEQENGLMWTAHARIKSSYGFPDKYKEAPFYKSDRFLGAAWKAMPADPSHPRLGTRVLDLFDDMNNWGPPKQVIGEVDIFKVQPDYELYGHMNVNYVKLDKLPKFEEGWAPLVDALRAGRFFVTTGEVLLPAFSVKRQGTKLEVEAECQGTFPLAFAEVIWGDGQKTYRHRIDMTDTEAFAKKPIRATFEAKGAKWARLEVWDVATNGAFTQPVRME